MLLLPLAILLSAVGAWLVSRHARRLGMCFGLMDYPDRGGGRKRHKRATPLVGGFGVFWACWIGSTALIVRLLVLGHPAAEPLSVLGAALGATALALVGLADDRFGLRASVRLIAATAILALVLTVFPDLKITSLWFTGQAAPWALPAGVGLLFSLLCLLGFQNSVNMADGKNGYVIGQALIWTLVLWLRAPATFWMLFAPLAAGLLVLMWFNLRGVLFLGDGGNYCLSVFYGLVAIVIWNLNMPGLRADDLALIFALPVFDTLRLMLTRMLKRRTPFTPGRDHLHHYLAMHWGWPRPLLWVLMIVLLPNLGAILLPGTALWWIVATFVVYAVLLVHSSHRPTARVRD